VATPPPPPDEPAPPRPAGAPDAPAPSDPGPGVCPRCGSPYEPGQEYCLECGLRLPIARGFFAAHFVPGLGRVWQRHLRWYPGDWIWPVVFGLVVAVLAATVAIVTTRNSHSAAKTIVATTETAPTETTTTPSPPSTATGTEPTGTEGTETTPTTTTTTPTETAPTTTETTPTQTTPSGPVKWPRGKTGFTVVLASLAHSDGLPSARKTVQKAIGAGLTDVGVLNSDNYSSLRAGYYVVFSGIFDTLDEAKGNLSTAQGTFPQAYTRRIVP
jgi:hypothetical protein